MTTTKEKILIDLSKLCVEIGQRHPGSEGNRDATHYVADRFREAGWQVDTPSFECIDWEGGTAQLTVDHQELQANVSPYSLKCKVEGHYVTASTVEELEGLTDKNSILVLHGELCKEQIMPKGYPFYNPESHQKIISLLEVLSPKAIVAITTQNPEVAGAVYPFPLFEDGSFDIPSVYMTDIEGEKLLASSDKRLSLEIKSERLQSTASNIIATKRGSTNQKIVLCAHVDTKLGTPGALDNGTGIVTLLTLADMIADYKGDLTIELVAFNGEDYYAASGELDYLKVNPSLSDNVVLAINTDGAAYKETLSGYSFYGCSESLTQSVSSILEYNKTFEPMEAWYQSDHMVFAMAGVPSIAVTSSNFTGLWTDIAHTEKDTIDIVSAERIMEIANAYREIIVYMDGERAL